MRSVVVPSFPNNKIISWRESDAHSEEILSLAGSARLSLRDPRGRNVACSRGPDENRGYWTY